MPADMTTVAGLPYYERGQIADYFNDLGSQDVLDRISQYLQSQKCIGMLEETDVIDEEYFREYLVFYATTHLEHPPTATRLHFFSTKRAELERLLSPTAGELSDRELEEIGYLGYLILRPSCPPTVGECMLKMPDDLREEKCFTHCATGFGQTLRGRRLRVETAPFISQDPTGMCAQAAIWGACKYLHKYRYYPKVSLPEITEMAGHAASETLFTRPAEGLTTNAMYSVLRQLGFQIYVANVRRSDNTREAVYTAIESGLPAILLVKTGGVDPTIPSHAVWAVGHTCRQPLRNDDRVAGTTKSEPGTKQHVSTSQWVGHFLVHDDQVGPYLPAFFKPRTGDASEVQQDLVYFPHKEGQPSHNYQDRAVLQVVVPLPGEVFVKPPEARQIALGVLLSEHLQYLVDQFNDMSPKATLSAKTMSFVSEMTSNSQRYAFRTYLCMSARYQEYAVASEKMCSALKTMYAQEVNLPEYVWVTEILDTQLMTTDRPEEWEAVVGELITDSTDPFALQPEQARGHRYLCLHIPGMFAWREGIGADDEQNQDRPQDEPDAPKSLLRADRQAVYNAVRVSNGEPHRPFGANASAEDGPRSHRNLGPLIRL